MKIPRWQHLRAIKVDYEVLEGIFDPLEAMQADADQVVTGEENVMLGMTFRSGDVASAMASADVIIENTYRTQWAEHAFLETEGSVARMEEGGGITVWSSCQAPHRDRMQVARALGLPESSVRVITPYIGGAFGGKDEAHVQMHAALLAFTAQRPVKLIRGRRESMLTHVKRHPIMVECTTAADSSGLILAVKARAIGDAGPYTNASHEVMNKFGEFIGGPYKVQNLEVEKSQFEPIIRYAVPSAGLAHRRLPLCMNARWTKSLANWVWIHWKSVCATG